MQVRRKNNLIECIMDSDDLTKYDLDVSELTDAGKAQDKITEKLNEILEDINDELDEDDKMEFEGPMGVEMLIGNSGSVLIRIHIASVEEDEEERTIRQSKQAFNRDEIRDFAFSFRNLDECILFAKQMKGLSDSLIQEGKDLKKNDIIAKEEDLELPDSFPEEILEAVKKFRKSLVDHINEQAEKVYENMKNFDGFEASLYKMNGIYYLIYKKISYNRLNGIPDEFYLNDITREPLPAYIEEHGEVIIKEKATEALASL